MTKRRCGSFIAGAAAGAILAGGFALAQGQQVLQGQNYGLARGNTATLFCLTSNGAPQPRGTPLVQQARIAVGTTANVAVVHVTCFD
ncbi:hypothetical protein KTR66_17830 [Roseococcus sp. SDR]|uniref:hypothetical protein n=1 Tax=Roseococcus sp. SDR TaxID=2835532 RepID=UPI001BCBD55C|nr:hypothetical protein [Roseococcus sp. SDR]MBS7791865.1 hypothetical protein [Roseococcus sp. SDR]MBV1847179.1 hypothetical protein [Roseococcus sp. SDR]